MNARMHGFPSYIEEMLERFLEGRLCDMVEFRSGLRTRSTPPIAVFSNITTWTNFIILMRRCRQRIGGPQAFERVFRNKDT